MQSDLQQNFCLSFFFSFFLTVFLSLLFFISIFLFCSYLSSPLPSLFLPFFRPSFFLSFLKFRVVGMLVIFIFFRLSVIFYLYCAFLCFLLSFFVPFVLLFFFLPPVLCSFFPSFLPSFLSCFFPSLLPSLSSEVFFFSFSISKFSEQRVKDRIWKFKRALLLPLSCSIQSFGSLCLNVKLRSNWLDANDSNAPQNHFQSKSGFQHCRCCKKICDSESITLFLQIWKRMLKCCEKCGIFS